MRWLIAMVVAMLLIQAIGPWLRKHGLGRLPGDFSFRALGREWHLPIGSTLVLSLLVTAIMYVI